MRSIAAAFPGPQTNGLREPSGVVATIRILTAARQSRIRTGFPDPDGSGWIDSTRDASAGSA